MKKLILALLFLFTLMLLIPSKTQAIEDCQFGSWTRTDLSCPLTCQAPYNEVTSREERDAEDIANRCDPKKGNADCAEGYTCKTLRYHREAEFITFYGEFCVKPVKEYMCTCCRTITPAVPGEPPKVDFTRLFGAFPGFKFAGRSLGDIVGAFLPPLFTIAGLILLLYLLWGGLSLMLSRGDPKAIEGARQKITNAVVGFVIIIVAFFLVQILGMIFGIEQFRAIF